RLDFLLLLILVLSLGGHAQGQGEEGGEPQEGDQTATSELGETLSCDFHGSASRKKDDSVLFRYGWAGRVSKRCAGLQKMSRSCVIHVFLQQEFLRGRLGPYW